MGYRIAGRISPKENLTSVVAESHFARCVRQLFKHIRPTRIIETGTYQGAGSTAIIASALRAAGVPDATFYSIEVNPTNCRKAHANLTRDHYRVSLLNGLSIPRPLLPTVEQIELQYVRRTAPDDVFIDHEEEQRAALYHQETDFPDVPDDMLGRCLREFSYRPDFLFLDSGGHVGHVEFQYVLPLLKGRCHIALDDIHHVKHHQSFRELQADPRFELLVASEEKFGFCIARFTPAL